MNLELTNKRVIVTGASRGIGLAIARSFLKEGAHVILVARNPEVLVTASSELKKEFGDDFVLSFAADVTRENEVKDLIQKVISHWGNIDILVANVGDGRSVPDPIPSAEKFAKSFSVNFSSAEIVAREALPEISKSSGSILFITSIAGIESIGAPTDYSVAKSALIALSKNMARKLAPLVRVNCIAPGNVFFPGGSWDEKIKQNPERVENIIQATVPMKRFGTPEEIGDAAVFLSSDRAGFITGTCLIIDGGQTVSLH